MDHCAAGGGGVAAAPRGRFLTGTIILKSNITLRLAQGAVLPGSPKLEDYNPPHLLFAEDADNIVRRDHRRQRAAVLGRVLPPEAAPQPDAAPGAAP